MAVDIDHVPTKSAQLVGERLEIVGVGDARALLQRVAINDRASDCRACDDAAVIAASQLLPSCNSPSPVTTKTRKGAAVDLARNGDSDGDRQCHGRAGPVLASTPGT